METEQRPEFYKAWSTMMELQAGQVLSDRALRLAFSLLEEYELFEIKQALRIHCKQSVFHAKPADIEKIIKGEVPSNAELFGLAQSADTILGAYVRHNVGEHDIARLSARDSTSRVASLRRATEAFVDRVQSGMMSNDEIRIYGGKGFDVTAELCPGLPGARVVHHELLKTRQAEHCKIQIKNGAESDGVDLEKHKPRSEAETQVGKRQLAELMATLELG